MSNPSIGRTEMKEGLHTEGAPGSGRCIPGGAGGEYMKLGSEMHSGKLTLS